MSDTDSLITTDSISDSFSLEIELLQIADEIEAGIVIEELIQ